MRARVAVSMVEIAEIAEGVGEGETETVVCAEGDGSRPASPAPAEQAASNDKASNFLTTL